MNCPNCGAALAGRPGFCSQCGHQLPRKRRIRGCPSCGVRVAETARTCLMCGAPLDKGRTVLASFSLSLLSLPILTALGLFIIVAAVWLLRPWESIEIIAYHTPTPTATFTPTAFPTSTPTPTATSTPTPTPTPEVIIYRVQRGDTLEALAIEFDTTVEAIMLVNNLTSDDVLQWGFDILIPEGPVGTGEGGVPEPTETVPPTGGLETYVVQSGDNLITIAAIFRTTVEALMEANEISSPEELQAGQELVIPGGGPTPVPTATPTPTPTRTPESAFGAPVLLTPPDGHKFGGGAGLIREPEVPVLLIWMSEGLLSEDEWYMVNVRYVAGAETAQQVTELTKATSYLAPLEMRPPPEAPSHLFEWDVGVVKETGTFPDGSPKVEPISPRSETRTFYW